MSIFLSVLLLTIVGILASIAIANWQKGGYRNAWIAFGWGMAAFLVFGVGAGLLYYYYIIKAAQHSEVSVIRNPTAKPPDLFLVPKIEPLAIGKPATLRTQIKNVGGSAAHNIRVCSQVEILTKDFSGPLKYLKADAQGNHYAPRDLPLGVPYFEFIVTSEPTIMTQKHIEGFRQKSFSCSSIFAGNTKTRRDRSTLLSCV